MKQRHFHPPEPRVIALAATKPKHDMNTWLLGGAYIAGALFLCNLLTH